MAADAPDILQKGTTARPGAMGNAFVAISDRSDSVYWNPANLAMSKMLNANTVHSSLGDFDMNTDMLTIASPIDVGESGIGFGVFRESITGIENVPLNARPFVDGYFDERETGVLLGYGVKVRDDLLVGATLKYLSMKFLTYSESGVGIDLGYLYTVNKNIKFGGNLQNVVPVELGDDKIPFNAKLGLAYTTTDKKLIIAADYDTNVAGESAYHTGLEYMIVPQLALRVGSDDGDLTAGVGLVGLAGGWQFDYAFANREVGDTQKFSVSFNFSDKPWEKKPKTEKAAPADSKPLNTPVQITSTPAPAAAPAPKVEEKKVAPAPKVEKPKEPAVETKPVNTPVQLSTVPVAEVAPAPKVEEKKAVAPAKVEEKKAEAPVETAKLISAYTFSEGNGVVSISTTELKAGQNVIVYKKMNKVAEVSISSVGMLSTSGKITKLYVEKLTDYMIGDQLGIK